MEVALGDDGGVSHGACKSSDQSWFAVYRYRANRPKPLQRASGSISGEGDAGSGGDGGGGAGSGGDSASADAGDVPSFLQDEATRNDDFSLSVIATNLPSAEDEQLNRKQLWTRLSRGCVYSGSGNVTTVERGSGDGDDASSSHLLCYFCLLRDDSEEQPVEDVRGLGTVATGSLVDLGGDGGSGEASAAASGAPSPSAASGGAVCSSDFVVCLLHEFESAEVEFDLFRPEMDSFCVNVVRPLLASPTFDPQAPGTDVTDTLAEWYGVCVEYLPRCASFFGEQLAVVIHAALIGRAMKFTGGTAEQLRDVQAFVRALSLTSLLDLPTSDNAEGLPTPRPASDTVPEANVVLSSDGSGFSISPMLETPEYCVSWAMEMRSVRLDPLALKRAIHKNELRVIQDINTMKRLICQAESNYYALYNAFEFLNSCETVGDVVLSSVLATAGDPPRAETQEVLDVLVGFVRSRRDRPASVDTLLYTTSEA
eukprot:m.239725 g.239725  ORF g.239725 m.239725 type:complete len:483 (-) comp18981_c2_seq3:114-1562(-)